MMLCHKIPTEWEPSNPIQLSPEEHGGNFIWLVVFRHPSEKYDFVNWDDDIPNIWENKIDVPNHQPVIITVAELHETFAPPCSEYLGL